jgi:hypothetical protein
VDRGRRLAGLCPERAGRGAGAHKGDLVRHHPARAGSAEGGQGAGAAGAKYFGWGSESVRLLADIKAGKMPANPIIDSGVDVVTAANVDQYVIGWKALEKP